jgi:hypothetical protein
MPSRMAVACIGLASDLDGAAHTSPEHLGAEAKGA